MDALDAIYETITHPSRWTAALIRRALDVSLPVDKVL
jgi:hypothetical protein